MNTHDLNEAFHDFKDEIRRINKSFKNTIEISQTETNLYKKLLEEEKALNRINSRDEPVIKELYILEYKRNTALKSRACIGIFSLESLALQAVLQGLKRKEYYIELRNFHIYKIELQSPYTKESDLSVRITRLKDYFGDEQHQYISGIKVDNCEFYTNIEDYTIPNGTTDCILFEKITLNEVDEHFLGRENNKNYLEEDNSCNCGW